MIVDIMREGLQGTPRGADYETLGTALVFTIAEARKASVDPDALDRFDGLMRASVNAFCPLGVTPFQPPH
jgi:hypothetical protein